ncbi:hypothetical protein IWX90DRAFT_318619 [Phyllosticta citrichinensis]|uniref:Uncharacterized protein n=1 Tax=Phyllosticta citrichinensis TaxID=1130410 RepID=A0ABR1XJB4_9PEZI
MQIRSGLWAAGVFVVVSNTAISRSLSGSKIGSLFYSSTSLLVFLLQSTFIFTLLLPRHDTVDADATCKRRIFRERAQQAPGCRLSHRMLFPALLPTEIMIDDDLHPDGSGRAYSVTTGASAMR